MVASGATPVSGMVASCATPCFLFLVFFGVVASDATPCSGVVASCVTPASSFWRVPSFLKTGNSLTTNGIEVLFMNEDMASRQKQNA